MLRRAEPSDVAPRAAAASGEPPVERGGADVQIQANAVAGGPVAKRRFDAVVAADGEAGGEAEHVLAPSSKRRRLLNEEFENDSEQAAATAEAQPRQALAGVGMDATWAAVQRHLEAAEYEYDPARVRALCQPLLLASSDALHMRFQQYLQYAIDQLAVSWTALSLCRRLLELAPHLASRGRGDGLGLVRAYVRVVTEHRADAAPDWSGLATLLANAARRVLCAGDASAFEPLLTAALGPAGEDACVFREMAALLAWLWDGSEDVTCAICRVLEQADLSAGSSGPLFERVEHLLLVFRPCRTPAMLIQLLLACFDKCTWQRSRIFGALARLLTPADEALVGECLWANETAVVAALFPPELTASTAAAAAATTTMTTTAGEAVKCVRALCKTLGQQQQRRAFPVLEHALMAGATPTWLRLCLLRAVLVAAMNAPGELRSSLARRFATRAGLCAAFESAARRWAPALLLLADDAPEGGSAAAGASSACSAEAAVMIVRAVADAVPSHASAAPLQQEICVAALFAAVSSGAADIVRLVLDTAREVLGSVSAIVNGLDRATSLSALHSVAQEGNVALVRMLCDAGADVNVLSDADDGTCALMVAAEYGHLEVVRLLLERGAQVNQTDALGSTALRLAGIQMHHGVVDALLQAGAQPSFTAAERAQLYAPRDWAMRASPGIRPTMRAIVISWLSEVVEEYRLKLKNLYYACDYFDRYVDAVCVAKSALQLVGIACLYLSSWVTHGLRLSVTECVFLCDSTYTAAQVSETIEAVRSFLLASSPTGLSPVIGLTYLNIFVCIAGVCIGHRPPSHSISSGSLARVRVDTLDAIRGDLLYMASFVAELALLAAQMVRYSPHVLAAAALRFALRLLGHEQWNDLLAEHALLRRGDPLFEQCLRDVAQQYSYLVMCVRYAHTGSPAYRAYAATLRKYPHLMTLSVHFYAPPRSGLACAPLA